VPAWLTRLCALLLGLSFLLSASGYAIANTEDDEKGRRTREIYESINSPFCPASTLATCGSPNAAEWRKEIRGWVDQGLTKNEICGRLEKRVQHRLCVGPTSPWMWSLPFLIAAASIGLLAFVLRRFVRPADEDVSHAEKGAPASGRSSLDERLDQELAALDDD
jgi:cytochrome c-type biogenesis protein CcmH/NrfF